MNLEEFKDRIEITCRNEEMATAINEVLKQYDALKEYCKEMMYDFAVDGDDFIIHNYANGSKVYIEILRPDYRGCLDPNFFDGSFEGICNYLEKRVPGAILSGIREYYNSDLFRSFTEYLSKDDDGHFSTVAVEEDESFEDDE